jgi:hypothetical protein
MVLQACEAISDRQVFLPIGCLHLLWINGRCWVCNPNLYKSYENSTEFNGMRSVESSTSRHYSRSAKSIIMSSSREEAV